MVNALVELLDVALVEVGGLAWVLPQVVANNLVQVVHTSPLDARRAGWYHGLVAHFVNDVHDGVAAYALYDGRCLHDTPLRTVGDYHLMYGGDTKRAVTDGGC